MRALLLLCLGLAWSGASRAIVPPLLPLQAFAEIPALDGPQLSPDGRTIVTPLRRNGEEHLLLHDLFGGEAGAAASRSLKFGPRTSVNWTEWLNDQYVVASVRQLVWIGSQGLPFDRLFIVDRATLSITPVDSGAVGLAGDDVIHWANDGSYIILNAPLSLGTLPSAVRVDLPSNKRTVLQEPQEGITRWVANSRGEIVAGTGSLAKGQFNLIYRASPRDDFELLFKAATAADPGAGGEPVDLVHIDADTQKGLMMARRGGDRWGLYEFDFRTLSYGATLFASDSADLDNLHFDRAGRLRWVSYVEGRRHFRWYTPEDSEFAAALEKAVPDRLVAVISASRDGSVKVVRTEAPTDPGTYFAYVTASGTMRRIGGVSDSLRRQGLAPTQYIDYEARDGLQIHAYLTRPAGREPVGLPLVVMPHGGPFVRDEWRYEFLVQYLANRGYVVFQPNYRGSTGYGKAFEEAGYQQAGRKMQDDLDDGVNWLAGKGTIDPKRVCILGWSFGGYAAEVASFRNPEIYRCAISVAGISDLAAQLRYDYRVFYGDDNGRRRALFQGDQGAGFLDDVSAMSKVDAISVPLLLVHGDADIRVPVSQSQNLANALRGHNKRVRFVRITDGDHNLWDEGQRLEMLTAVESFLAENNPTDVLGTR